MTKYRVVRALGLLVMFVLVVFSFAACGGGSGNSDSQSAEPTSEASEGGTAETGGAAPEEPGDGAPISIDVGSKKIEFPAGTQPNIAYFAANGNSYQEAAKEAAEAKADEMGAKLTWIDSEFSPEAQLPDLQNALATGGYNAWIFENYSAEASCPLIKKAIDQGIVVVQKSNLTCGSQNEPADESAWLEGTLATVGGSTSSTYYEAYANEVKAILGGTEDEVAVFTGQLGVVATENMTRGVQETGFNPVATIHTNYTTPEALAETQTLLQGHPGIEAILTSFTDTAIGVVRAIETDGGSSGVRVFDLGGSEVDVKLIEEGKLTMSQPIFPKTEAEEAVETIAKAFAGEKSERFQSGLAEGTPSHPVVVTKANVRNFKPEY